MTDRKGKTEKELKRAGRREREREKRERGGEND